MDKERRRQVPAHVPHLCAASWRVFRAMMTPGSVHVHLAVRTPGFVVVGQMQRWGTGIETGRVERGERENCAADQECFVARCHPGLPESLVVLLRLCHFKSAACF